MRSDESLVSSCRTRRSVCAEHAGQLRPIPVVSSAGIRNGWSTGEDLFPLFAASRACEELENWARCISGPPVCSIGELRRFVKDEYTAYLTPAGGADAFGRRVLDVLSDPVAATEVGRRGRELAVREFDYRRYGDILREWFTALAEGGSNS